MTPKQRVKERQNIEKNAHDNQASSSDTRLKSTLLSLAVSKISEILVSAQMGA